MCINNIQIYKVIKCPTVTLVTLGANKNYMQNIKKEIKEIKKSKQLAKILNCRQLYQEKFQ